MVGKFSNKQADLFFFFHFHVIHPLLSTYEIFLLNMYVPQCWRLFQHSQWFLSLCFLDPFFFFFFLCKLDIYILDLFVDVGLILGFDPHLPENL